MRNTIYSTIPLTDSRDEHVVSDKTTYHFVALFALVITTVVPAQ